MTPFKQIFFFISDQCILDCKQYPHLAFQLIELNLKQQELKAEMRPGLYSKYNTTVRTELGKLGKLARIEAEKKRISKIKNDRDHLNLVRTLLFLDLTA